MTQLATSIAAPSEFAPWLTALTNGYEAPTRDAEAMRRKMVEAESRLQRRNAPPVAAVMTTEQRLALARAQAKQAARKFSMLFDPEWFTGLSRQIDAMLDPDEWSEVDAPLSADSFKTLLVVLMQLRHYRRAGLGLTGNGNVVATWSRSANDRLIVECLPSGRVRWIATAPVAGVNESGTMETTPDRLLLTLAAFNPDHWLQHERR
jgi:hypothetical protein